MLDFRASLQGVNVCVCIVFTWLALLTYSNLPRATALIEAYVLLLCISRIFSSSHIRVGLRTNEATLSAGLGHRELTTSAVWLLVGTVAALMAVYAFQGGSSIKFRGIPNWPGAQQVAMIIAVWLAVPFIFGFLYETPPRRVRFERHWGGLGGGMTGWHLSAGLVRLAAVLITLATIAYIAGLAHAANSSTPANPPSSQMPDEQTTATKRT